MAAERMEAEVLGLFRSLDGRAETLTGVVRLTATPFFCAHLLVPMLNAFLQEHPGLQIELIGDSRNLDLSRREADLALRLSRPEMPGLVTRPLGKVAFGWYAAATDLRPFAEQRFLGYDDASGHNTLLAYFNKLVPADRVIMRSNITQTLLEAVRANLGCAILPCFVGERDAALRRVFAPHDITPMTLWLVYHEDLRRSPRLRAAVQLIDVAIAAYRSLLDP
ncbi:LysR family transcriptional regulator [Paracoccus rhizosphaerae]|uniref:LysR family transcriptional regulator n=1 Tax=Paracoccus rhizosphaerae TaxID=1133347 RepID=A0ABV6CDP0_9RHOB|nr:substrate-binding domain-containing protein [Paracoccus rhizosphaerae]